MAAKTKSKPGAVFAELPEITELSGTVESHNILVYGDPGVGKTVFAGSIPSPGLIIATEPGLISAKRFGSKAKAMHPQTLNEFLAIVEWIKLDGERARGFKWVAIDTLTEAQNMMMRGILVDPNKAGRKGHDPDVPQIQDHLKSQLMFKRLVHTINALPVNVLYTAHAMRTEDEEGEPIVLPDISGKNGTNDPTTMSRWVCGTMQAYGYLGVKKAKGEDFRRIVFKRSGPYFGKDRYGVLTPYVDNPDMAEIDKLISGELPAHTARSARKTRAASRERKAS